MKDPNRKKRILYYFMYGGSAGGSDTCLYYLIKHLDKSKYEPYLLYKNKNILVDQLEDIGIKLIPFSKQKKLDSQTQLIKNTFDSNSPKKVPGNLRLLLSGLKNLIKRSPEILKLVIITIRYHIDIVHTNHFLTGDRLMLLASILLKKKIVSHNRGLYSSDLLDRYLSNYVDKIVCMSDFSKSVYVKSGVSEKKCKTIYDGIDTNDYKSSNSKPSNNERDKLIIGCIGRLEKWKGQQVLVEAADIIIKSIPEITFLFVGTGNNEEELKIQVKNKGLEKYFKFTGNVTNVKDYIEKCIMTVHTSIEPEPFGMVIIEAMALKKPVIATSIGGPLEIIDNENDGFLIPPQNPSILAEFILKLVENPNLRDQIGKKAREKVVTKFDVRVYIKQIEKVYEEIFNLEY